MSCQQSGCREPAELNGYCGDHRSTGQTPASAEDSERGPELKTWYTDWKESQKLPKCGEHCEHVHGDQADPDLDELASLRVRVVTLEAANRVWSTMVDRLRAELAGSVNECSAAKRERDILWANNDQQELLIRELRKRADK